MFLVSFTVVTLTLTPWPRCLTYLGSTKMCDKHEVCRSSHSRFIAQRVVTDVLFVLVWPWPDDLDIWSQEVSEGGIPSHRKWTFEVKDFESCHMTDRHPQNYIPSCYVGGQLENLTKNEVLWSYIYRWDTCWVAGRLYMLLCYGPCADVPLFCSQSFCRPFELLQNDNCILWLLCQFCWRFLWCGMKAVIATAFVYTGHNDYIVFCQTNSSFPLIGLSRE